MVALQEADTGVTSVLLREQFHISVLQQCAIGWNSTFTDDITIETSVVPFDMAHAIWALECNVAPHDVEPTLCITCFHMNKECAKRPDTAFIAENRVDIVAADFSGACHGRDSTIESGVRKRPQANGWTVAASSNRLGRTGSLTKKHGAFQHVKTAAYRPVDQTSHFQTLLHSVHANAPPSSRTKSRGALQPQGTKLAHHGRRYSSPSSDWLHHFAQSYAKLGNMATNGWLFCVTRYARGAGGITPFRAAYDRDYTKEILPLAEIILFKILATVSS